MPVSTRAPWANRTRWLVSALMLMGLVGLARLDMRGEAHGSVSAVSGDTAAMIYRDLRFHDREDGAVTAQDPATGLVVAVFAPGTNGFVRATLRGLARERKRGAGTPEIPFRLTAWSDGRLVLEDPVTGRKIDLRAFGPTNAGAFATLLRNGSAS
jgi:putative photosynthetic complex assembly protein